MDLHFRGTDTEEPSSEEDMLWWSKWKELDTEDGDRGYREESLGIA